MADGGFFMNEALCSSCSVLKAGVWNGAETDWRGRLLYKVLLQDAMDCGLRGGTVWSHVEGSRSKRTFRTVESEVSSNQLPVLLEFVDTVPALERFIPVCQKRMGKKGILVVEQGHVWPTGDGGGGDAVKEPGHQQPTNVPEHTSGVAYDGLQVQIFTLEQNRIGGKPVYQAVAEFLRHRDILWVSTARSISGYGHMRQIRSRARWFQKSDVPIVVTVLDKAETLEPCLPELVTLVDGHGFIVSKPVVWHHPSHP
jgi:PII-like signaling protein